MRVGSVSRELLRGSQGVMQGAALTRIEPQTGAHAAEATSPYSRTQPSPKDLLVWPSATFPKNPDPSPRSPIDGGPDPISEEKFSLQLCLFESVSSCSGSGEKVKTRFCKVDLGPAEG